MGYLEKPGRNRSGWRLNTTAPLNRRRRISYALVAVCLFACANIAFAALIRTGGLDRFQMTTHNWAWWATKCLEDHKQPVDVMLMGSSLMQRVMDEGEATYLNKTIDAITHRNSNELEDLLTKQLHRPVKTWSYAIGGLHASDASVVTSALLRGEHQPAAIVYGIAPRDLMNNLLASPCATETFQLMNKLTDQSDIGLKARTSNGEKFDYFVSTGLGKALPIYDFHAELAQCFRRSYKHKVDEVANKYVEHPTNPIGTLDQISLHMVPEEFEGSIPIPPFNPAHPTCEDNKLTYMFAYRPFRHKFYKTQKYFLERMLQTANERGIQVVFVNMPLRKDNFEAMEPGFYDLYLKDIKGLASQYKANYVEMNRPQTFAFSDFTDQVHLNGRGAVKFVAALAPEVGAVLNKPKFAMAPGQKQNQ